MNHRFVPTRPPLSAPWAAPRALSLFILIVSATSALSCEDPPVPQEIQDYREAQDPDNCTPTSDPTEVCDGLDNDCDGLIDTDDKGLTRPSCDRDDRAQGVCEDVTRPDDHCLGADRWKTEPCSDDDFAAEVGDDFEPTETSLTDGLDNDCDGVTDAPTVITPPDASVPKDTTTPTDTAGPTDVTDPSDTTDPGDTQSPECSGDDDCDPHEKNDHFVSCIDGFCEEQACALGTWNNDKEEPGCEHECTPGEVHWCDEVDDDCDEVLETVENTESEACTDSNGCHGFFELSCFAGDGLKKCIPSVAEACTADNEFGSCQGLYVCGVGGSFTCNAPTPEAEICDGQDNDCDELTDEDAEDEPLTQSCYTGSADTKDVGACLSGTAICQGSNWGECVGEVLPEDESCDGQDEDCDDAVDEGFVDTDADGVCDGIDEDIDGDGVANDGDTCPLVPNPVQAYQHDDPSVCCGCPSAPEGLHEAFACVDGGCVPIRCIATHYDDPDVEGLDCQARPELWVDGVDGSDIKTGLSEGQALRSIDKALEIAQPWTLIRVKPATYDEGVTLNIRGLRIQGEGGAATLTYPANWGHNVVVTASDVTLGPDLIIRPATVGVAIGTVSGDPLTPNVRVEGVVIESLTPQPFDSQTSWVAGIQAYHSPKLVIEGVTIQGLDASEVVDPGGMKVTGIELSNCDDVTIEDVAISALFGATGGMTGGITVSASDGLTLSSVEVSGLTAHEDGHAVGVDLYNQSGAITFTDLRISGLVGGSQSVPAGEPLVDMGAAIGIDLGTGTESSTDPIVMRDIHLSGLQVGAISDAAAPVYAVGIRVDTNRPLAIRHLLVSEVHAQGGGQSAAQLIGVDIQRAFNSIIEQAVFDDIGAGLTENAGRAVVVSDQGVTEDVIIKNSIVHRVRGVAFEVTTSSGKGGILVRNGLIGPVRPWHYAYHYGEATYGDDVEFLDTQWWVDPHFIDPGGADFRLLPSSPAIDAGTGGLAPFTDEGPPDLHHCWEPQHNGGAVNIGLYGNTAEATVRPGAPMGAGCTSDDAPPFFHSPGCAEGAYIGDAIDGAPCGCFDSGIGEVDAECYGTVGQCEGAPGSVLCEPGQNTTVCSSQLVGNGVAEDEEGGFAGWAPVCNYDDADCDGIYDSTGCGACLGEDDQAIITAGMASDPQWGDWKWINHDECLTDLCEGEACSLTHCANLEMSGLSPGCHQCYEERLDCLVDGCGDDCLSSSAALGSEACAACAADTLCDLARNKCALFDGGLHPCETLCDMRVDSDCVDATEHETCLTDCTPLATTDDPGLDTVACRIARLQDGESCEAIETLCADLDKDGQNPHMGDCDDVSDEGKERFLGNPEICDGIDNDCDGVRDGTLAATGVTEAWPECPDGQMCVGAAGCVSAIPSCNEMVSDFFGDGDHFDFPSGVNGIDSLNLGGKTQVTIAGWVRRLDQVLPSTSIIDTPWIRVAQYHTGYLNAVVHVDSPAEGCVPDILGNDDDGAIWLTTTSGCQNCPENQVGDVLSEAPNTKLQAATHIAVTWDGATAAVWVNGILAQERTIGDGGLALDPECSGEIRLGYGLGDDGEYVYSKSTLSHVSVFDRALDSDELIALAQGDLPPDDLLAYWPLDEADNTVARDLVGGHHGTYLEGTGRLDDIEALEDWTLASFYPDIERTCLPATTLSCSGEVEEQAPYCLDVDEDGFTTLTGDCDDVSPQAGARAPDKEELCDGIDNDCDGVVDEGTHSVIDSLTPTECAEAGQICLGSAGCIGGVTCMQALFGISDHGPSAESGVTVTELLLDGATELTVAAWVRKTSANWGHRPILEVPGVVRLYIKHSQLHADLYLEDGQAGCEGDKVYFGYQEFGVTPPGPYLNGYGWSHAALTWDGESISTYINGVLTATAVQEDSATPLESGCVGETTIGYELLHDEESGEAEYTGADTVIRHLSVWRDALDPEALLELAQGRLPAGDLVALWPLDEGGGSVARDASGHGHDGTYLDTTEWFASADAPYLDTPPICPPEADLTCSGDPADWPAYCQDTDGDGQIPLHGDCDDGEPAVYSGAPALCDGLKNDCLAEAIEPEADLCGAGQLCIGHLGCLDEAVCEPSDCMGPVQCDALVFGDQDTEKESQAVGVVRLKASEHLLPAEIATTAWVRQSEAGDATLVTGATWALEIADGGLIGRTTLCDGTLVSETPPSDVQLTVGDWHHVAFQHDALSGSRVYLNGQLLTWSEGEDQPLESCSFDGVDNETGPQATWIGGTLDDPDALPPIQGQIRHLTFWSVGNLSAESIAQIGQGQVHPDLVDHLLGWYPLGQTMPDYGHGIVADVGPHDHDGEWMGLWSLQPTATPPCPDVPITCLDKGVDAPAICADLDQDGWAPLEGDCDDDPDTGALRSPDNTLDDCNGIDDDCDGYIDGQSTAGCGVDEQCVGVEGCVLGTPCQAYHFGYDGDVLHEAGIDLPDLNLVHGEPMTLAAWVLHTGSVPYPGPIIRTPTLRLQVVGSGPQGTMFYGSCAESYQVTTNNNWSIPDQGAVLMNSYSRWNFLALTWDGESLRTWINGSVGAEATPDWTMIFEPDCTGPSSIGHGPDLDTGEHAFAQAAIRHASIWRRALDGPELAALAVGKIPSGGGLEGYWPMDEDTPFAVPDVSGNAHHGSHTALPMWADSTDPGGEALLCLPTDTLSCVNGTSDPLCKDEDEDDFTVLEGDCDDESSNFHPGHTEICDGYDKDCDGDYYDHDVTCLEGTFCAGGMACLGTELCEALTFSGVEATWYRVPEDVGLRSYKNFTLAAWIRPEAPPEGRDVQGIIDHDAMYGLALGRDGRLEARVRLPAADESCGEAQPWLTVTSLPGTIPLNTWSWVVATFDASYLRIYRNGIEVGIAETGGLEQLNDGGYLNDSCEGSGLDLGRRGPEGAFVGQMRQVSLLSSSLNTWHQQLLGKGQLNYQALDKVTGHWPMDGPGLTQFLVDYSPGQHHAERVTVDYEASAFFAESCQVLGPSSIGGDLVGCGAAMSWFDAREACIGMGGDLASIHTDGDNALITEVTEGESWVGLTDAAQESVFQWSDGSPFDYETWAENEPNEGVGGEDCASVWWNGLWDDLPCSTERWFACRIPASPVVPEWTSRDDCPVSQVLGPASDACAKAGGGGSINSCATDNDCGDAACVDETCQAYLCLDGDGDGWLPMAGDCDDHDSHVHATHIESCNGVDDDCDGVTDPGSTCCGNGEIDGVDEVCDDGNTEDEDACSADCSRIGYPLAYYDMEEGTGGAIANKSLRYPGEFGGALLPAPPELTSPQFVQEGNPAGGHHLQFDGTSQVGAFPGWEQDGVDLWLAAARFSIAAWVRPDALPVANGDLANQATIITVGDGGRLAASHRPGEGWNFSMRDKGVSNDYYVTTAIDHASYAIGRWTHLVGTHDGDWVRLYVDGVEVVKHHLEPNTGWPESHMYGGPGTKTAIATSVHADRYFTGAVDEVSLWDEALGPDDVKALYNGGVPASANALASDGTCGDGAIGPGEACDDGNLDPYDGCEPDCTASVPGDHCQNAIEIPQGAFAPGDCGDTPCRVATVSGDTSLMTNRYEVTCEGATPGAPEAVYSFQTDGNRFKAHLTTEAHMVLHVATVTEGCSPWSGGLTACPFNPGGGETSEFSVAEGTQQLTLDGFDGPASGEPFDLTVMLYTCGNGVVDLDAGEECDDGNDGSGDGCSDWCLLETEAPMIDCAAIHAEVPSSPSGRYDIYPDGDEDSKVTVWCDMTTAGGGWTQIYLADDNNLNDTKLDYTVTASELRSTEFEAMIAYMPAAGGPLTAPTRFAMPQHWVDAAPMTYDQGETTVTLLQEGDATLTQGTLKYGGGSFMNNCTAEWGTLSWGRICIEGTNAPFYASFNQPTDDTCSLSTEHYTETDCSDERRFAILVRRPICGNGQVELGEGCEPEGENVSGCTYDCRTYDIEASPDCLAILDATPGVASGHYTIDPEGPGTGAGPTTVYCDMETQGGGWTYCGRRIDATVLEGPDSESVDWQTRSPGEGDNWHACHRIPDADQQMRIDGSTSAEAGTSKTWFFPGLSPLHGGQDMQAALGEDALLDLSPDYLDTCQEAGKTSGHQFRITSFGAVLGVEPPEGCGITETPQVFVQGSGFLSCAPEDTLYPPYINGNCLSSDGVDNTTPVDVGLDLDLFVRRGTCGDGVLDPTEACDDGNASHTDGCTSTCVNLDTPAAYAEGLADCVAIQALVPSAASGVYLIDPDGPGGDAPIEVHCDMVTDGGGWTRIFIAQSDNYESVNFAYSPNSDALLATNTAVMIGFADAWLPRARFAMPASWLTVPPMTHENGGETVDVAINGEEVLVPAELKYGWGGYFDDCEAEWSTSGFAGRICLSGTEGPYWSSFADVTIDYCNDSSEGFDAQSCGEDKRFAIQVRRPVCGNGRVEIGESCDDQNDDNTDGCSTGCQP